MIQNNPTPNVLQAPKPIINTSPSPINNTNQSGVLQSTLMPKTTKIFPTIVTAFLIVVLGLVSGFGLSRLIMIPSHNAPTTTPTTASDIEVGKIYGNPNGDFIDQAEGVLISGGINGEGTHRLLRPGGESQIICLTSSVLDLDLFNDHKIKLAGETFDTQKCGWFMDVGRVEVVELNAPKPFELPTPEALEE